MNPRVRYLTDLHHNGAFSHANYEIEIYGACCSLQYGMYLIRVSEPEA